MGLRPTLPPTRASRRSAEPVTHHVVDAEGGELDLCDGHVTDVRTRMVGDTVTPLF